MLSSPVETCEHGVYLHGDCCECLKAEKRDAWAKQADHYIKALGAAEARAQEARALLERTLAFLPPPHPNRPTDQPPCLLDRVIAFLDGDSNA